MVMAGALCGQLAPELAPELVGRSYPVLRETRMAAVVCELAGAGDAGALAAVVGRSGAIARAVVRAVRQAWERPGDDNAD